MGRYHQPEYLAALSYLRAHEQQMGRMEKRRIDAVVLEMPPEPDEALKHACAICDLNTLHLIGDVFTDEGFRFLPKLRKLVEFHAYAGKITARGLMHLKTLPHLSDLSLSTLNHFDRDAFEQIAALDQLQSLELSTGEICDEVLAPLARLELLTNLHLSGFPRLQGLCCQFFESLPRLRRLALGEISDSWMPHVAKLSQIESLTLRGEIHDEGLWRVEALDQLVYLTLWLDNISPDGLAVVAKLPNLEYLKLTGFNFTDDYIPAIALSTSLQRIRLSNEFLSESGRERLEDLFDDGNVEYDEDWDWL